MTLNQSLIAELQMEAANTRKMLACVPTEKNDWHPHHMSMSLGRLSSHVAELTSWITMTLTTPELDFSKMDYKPFIAGTNEELLALHDKNVADAVEALTNASDEEFNKMWTLRNGEKIYFTMPKIVVLRGMCMNHIYHHRGQLSVFLRLLNVAIPGMYGPSKDEEMAMKLETEQAN